MLYQLCRVEYSDTIDIVSAEQTRIF
jgi:hypothetical protein